MQPNEFTPPATEMLERLMAHYLEVVPDRFEDDDPRRESIALELYDIAAAADLKSAMDIISFWEIPDSIAGHLVASIRSAFSAGIRTGAV